MTMVLVTEIFKIINDINHIFFINQKTFFSKVRPNDIEVRYYETTSYGDKSLNILDPKIWNHQPSNIQFEISLVKFEEYINTWFGPKCKCSVARIIDLLLLYLFMYLL